MSQYKVIIKEEAQADLKNLLRYEPKAYKKALRLIGELYVHPKTGLGHPEPLKGKPEGRWSREITKKHRLVYRIFETEVHVDVLSAYGHYNDKQPCARDYFYNGRTGNKTETTNEREQSYSCINSVERGGGRRSQ